MCLRHRPKLVDAVAMVAMRMGDDDAVEAADVRREQLLAKVRPAIDQQALAGAFDQDRGAQAAIARLGRDRNGPIRCRSSARRSTSRSRGSEPSRSCLAEKLEEIGRRRLGQRFDVLPPQLGHESSCVGDERRLAFLAAVRDRREEGRVRLDQHLVWREPLRRLLQVLRRS